MWIELTLNQWRSVKKKRAVIAMIFSVILLVLYYFSLSDTIFRDPYSTVLQARTGALLSATIARDGQWRFPEIQHVPQKFKEAIVTYEDKRFWYHPGVDPLSFVRAIRQNIQAGRIVSGGSTLSMQVIRLSRKGKPRTIIEKCIELILATRLELKYTKEEIVALYASHAPFGGNVVGIEAACWRYFGRDPASLSWSEAALLAVLPNSPALIHPGKNRERLRQKRNNLLDRLYKNGTLDAFTCSLAKEEAIPEEPHPLPRMAKHLLVRMRKEGFAQQQLTSSIDLHLQQRVEQIVHDHHQRLLGNQIHNAAALIAKVSTGEVLAYAGNVSSGNRHEGHEVDVITAPRSTGSILKPFLYAAMLDEGKILPKTLLPDIPTLINGFSPKNFSKEYDGAVPADNALIRSLNIPAVHMLRDYRYERFHGLLSSIGMQTLNQPPDHYGLSLILGGAEGTLWDICGMYASMARTLNNYFTHPGKNRYDKDDFHALTYAPHSLDKVNKPAALEEHSWLSAAAIYQTFDVLKELYRPGEESGWRHFHSAKKIAWKTGTSFGFRDGWAIGTTPEYVVGVWVGNADGEGRPGLTGTDAAAPLLFDLFSQLDSYTWFKAPQPEMESISVCAKSGLRNSTYCPEVVTLLVSRQGLQSGACTYHQQFYVSPDKQYRLHSACEKIGNMTPVSWFVLPPVQEYYYRSKHVSYQRVPPFRSDCAQATSLPSMALVYPKPGARVFIPRGLTGAQGNAIFQLAHRDPAVTVFWHLDGVFIGTTRNTHQLPLNPTSGKHRLTIVDEHGESLEQTFEVLSSM